MGWYAKNVWSLQHEFQQTPKTYSEQSGLFSWPSELLCESSSMFSSNHNLLRQHEERGLKQRLYSSKALA
jgi:hypothetical protein